MGTGIMFYISYACIQWEHGTSACTFYRTTRSAAILGANSSCHDEVDFSLCFEDTAILYGICTVFWVLAEFSFCRGNPGLKPPLNFRPLYASKLVRPLSRYLTLSGSLTHMSLVLVLCACINFRFCCLSPS